jgi:carboxylesterase type B
LCNPAIAGHPDGACKGLSADRARRRRTARHRLRARSVGIEGDGAEALAALRALPAEKLVEGASAPEVLAGIASGQPVVGVSGSILDGRFLIEPPEAAFAAARQAIVPVIVGANSRDLGIGMAETKDDLFALFGDHAKRRACSTTRRATRRWTS